MTLTSRPRAVAPLSAAALDRAAGILRLLANPTRLRIVDVLRRTGPAPVHAVVRAAGRRQSATSRHLGRLRSAGILRAERRGREVWYALADPRCGRILACAGKARKRG